MGTVRLPGDQRGVSLAELVVSIVILGVAVAGIATTVVVMGGRSADPQRTQQATAVARGYLDEILPKPVADPPDGAAETGGAEEGSRSDYDDIQDYDGLSESPPRDQTGANLPLPGYTASVSVVSGVTLGPSGDEVAVGDAFRVDVTVDDGRGHRVTVSGYRAQR